MALLTFGSSPRLTLLLNAICFAIGGAIGVAWTLATGGFSRLRGVGWRVYAFGTVGLFGYHALYFTALRLAPAAEAGLIAYLWPLLIVLFSGLLPGERLRGGHLLGAAAAFSGAALILAPSATGGFAAEHAVGYAAAGVCALLWSGYSVLSRVVGAAPTDSGWLSSTTPLPRGEARKGSLVRSMKARTSSSATVKKEISPIRS